VLVDRNSVDQPFTEAETVPSGPDVGQDRVYVGLNDFGAAGGRTATVEFSLDAAVAAPVWNRARIETRATAGQNGPQIRPAVHPDGTVYAVFYGWRNFSATSQVTADVVVVRDDNWGQGANPFTALVDASDGLAGRLLATGVGFQWNARLGQERLGGDLAIAVDPNDSDTVYVAFCDVQAGNYTIHVRRSTNRGVDWSADLRTIANAKNPSLAINAAGKVALAFQQVVGSDAAARWQTQLETTTNAFGAVNNQVMADTPANTPAPRFLPYLGDYIHMTAVGNVFFGVFSANNTPDNANFPQGVTYQRNADFNTHQLLANDGVTPVATSIDPFFFKAKEQLHLTRLTRFTSFTRLTSFTRFTRFTALTRFTRFTRLTALTRFTPFTRFTRLTTFTGLTRFTQFTRFTRLTRFTPFTRFTRFTRFDPLTRFDRFPPFDFGSRTEALAAGAGEFVRFGNRIFDSQELDLALFPEYEEAREACAAAGITHLHQLAVATPTHLAACLGVAPLEAAMWIAAAQAILRRLS
jgi:hypothetical protein